jgi:hypothetical protein
MKHPNNGPSLSKAPSKKRKPMSDEESADWRARKKVEQEQAERSAAVLRRFHQAANRGDALDWLRASRGEKD